MSGGPAEGRRPGGSGAVLGFRLISLSGVQGVALVASNLLQLGTIAAVAGFLGAADLGTYSLLLFAGGLVTMVFSLAAKPGTIRRTFGGGDDDDDDDEDEESIVSATPKRSLGAGLLWAALLGILASALVVLLREPIAGVLLQDRSQSDLILWAGLLGGSGVLFKTASISLWFERRPSAFLIAEIVRPLLSLAVMVPLLASGGDLTDAIAGAAAGNVLGALLATVLLRGSFEPNLEPAEVFAIFKGGGRRVPIVSSIWIVQNADVFLLSRFVDASDLGIYALASKVGLVVSFFPQGFRVAMRPLRKSPAFKAVRSQYGRSIADGQILGYFVLVCISSVLVMVLIGQLLIDIAPPEFEDAAPLIPLTAAGLTMPALWRTMHSQTAWPGKSRLTFVVATMLAAAMFVGICLLLAPEIGIYAAPVAMLVGFSIPISYFFVRCQLSENRIDFPYREVGRALLVATVIGVGFHLLPEMPALVEALVIALLVGLYLAALLVLRVVPENHWPALSEMATSMLTGRADRVNPRRGLRALEPGDRELLRVAVCERMSPAAFAEPAAVPKSMLRPGRPMPGEVDGTVGGRLVWALRGAGRAGGSPLRRRSDWDDEVLAEFLFADEPPAVRSATMRRLLGEGADPADLRALEDLVAHLQRIPPDAWEGAGAAESGAARRRRAAGRRGRDALSRAARAIGRRV
jgi:O-antigen/teichoic acid export membrane protein